MEKGTETGEVSYIYIYTFVHMFFLFLCNNTHIFFCRMITVKQKNLTLVQLITKQIWSIDEKSYLTYYCNIFPYPLIPLIFRRQLLRTGSEGMIKFPVNNLMLTFSWVRLWITDWMKDHSTAYHNTLLLFNYKKKEKNIDKFQFLRGKNCCLNFSIIRLVSRIYIPKLSPYTFYWK